MPAILDRYDLLRSRLERFTRWLHGVEERDVIAVHQARVASRRLRELLPVLQLDPDVARKLGRRLRKVTRRLGVVRELDVLIDVLRDLGESQPLVARSVGLVAESMGRERDRVRNRLLAKLSASDLGRLAAKLEKIASALEAEAAAPRSSRPAEADSWRAAIEARVARRASVLSGALSAAGAMYAAEPLHAVRIAEKKLRYALEVLADVSRARYAADIQLLRRVQDTLGRLHDYQVLIGRVRQLQTSLTPPEITIWRALDRLMIALEDECRRLHGRYMRYTVMLSALCDRMAGPSADRQDQKVQFDRTLLDSSRRR